MSRLYSLAYLTANTLTVPQALQVAAHQGYQSVGLRLLGNGPGAPFQPLIDAPEVLREALAVQRDTGVGVFDLEIVRIGEGFDPRTYLPLFEVGAQLKAKAVLVAGDDKDEARLIDGYARLCETMAPFGLTADLEFMPWTAVSDANTALRVVRGAGSPANAGILVDALHVSRSTTTLDDLRALPRELLHYAQICDAMTSAQIGRPFTVDEMIFNARVERLLAGEGGIDLTALFSALPDDLPISVEIPHQTRMAQRGASGWAADALATSRALIESL